MKRRGFTRVLLLTLCVVMALLPLAACKKGEDGGGESGAFTEFAITEAGVLSWNNVTGAEKYIVRLERGNEVETDKTSADVTTLNLPNGKSTLTVIADGKFDEELGAALEVDIASVIVKRSGSAYSLLVDYTDQYATYSGFEMKDGKLYRELSNSEVKENMVYGKYLSVSDVAKAKDGYEIKLYEDAALSKQLQYQVSDLKAGNNVIYIAVVQGGSLMQSTEANLYLLAEFTVRLRDDGGNSYADVKTEENAAIAKPQDPVFENNAFAFVGWVAEDGSAYDFNAPVKKSFTLYSKYAPTPMTLDANGGSVSAATANFPVGGVCAGWKLPVGEKAGEGFVGWFDEATNTKLTDSEGNVLFVYTKDSAYTVLTAHYAASVRIGIDLAFNESADIRSYDVPYGGTVKMNIPNIWPSEADFIGYFNSETHEQVTGADGTIIDSTLVEDIRVYAKWWTDTNTEEFYDVEEVDWLDTAGLTPKDPEVKTLFLPAKYNGKPTEINLNDLQSLESITVSGKHAQYNSMDGMLYSKDKTTLLRVPLARQGAVVIPDSVTSIGDFAFRDCYGLTSVTIPDSVTSIGEGAFATCIGLTSVTIPDSVMSIGKSAFETCRGLQSVTIGTGVTSIGESAFRDCSDLTSVTIPGNVKSIGNFAFYWCTSLTSVTIENGVTSIGGSAFSGCDKLTSITIPDSVTGIGEGSFDGTGIWNNTPEDSVVYADKWAIGYNGSQESVTNIVFKSGTVGIGDSAFRVYNYGANNLQSVTIPDSVTCIGAFAFSGRDKLTDIRCEAESQPTGWSSDWKYDCPATVHWGWVQN